MLILSSLDWILPGWQIHNLKKNTSEILSLWL